MRDTKPTINLQSPETTGLPFYVDGMDALSVDIQAAAWSTAVVTLKWSIELGLYEKWHAFENTITFDTTTPARRNLPVRGCFHVRLEVTTAAAAASSEATVIMKGAKR